MIHPRTLDLRRLATPLALAAAALACTSTPPPVETPPGALATHEQRALLPTDDGFQAVVFYGAELMGSISGCDCFGTPEGGSLAYRYAYLSGFHAAFSGAAVLHLDAGFAMGPTRDAQGKELGDLVAKDDSVLAAYDRFGVDAANFTAHDAAYLARYWGPAAATAASAHPALSRFVSANLVPVAPGTAAPSSYVVRELAGSRLTDGPIRIAIVGLTEDVPGVESSGYRVTDPVAALERVLPAARAESDVVLVAAFMAPERVGEITRRFADRVDLFVVAHPNARDKEPTLGAPPRVVYARYKTIRLGEVRLWFEGKRLTRAENRYVHLDEPLPKDPAAAALAAEAKATIRRAQLDRFGASADANRP